MNKEQDEQFSDPFVGVVPLLFKENKNGNYKDYGSTTEPLKTDQLVMMTRGMNHLMESFKYKTQAVSYSFHLPHSWTTFELRRPRFPTFRLHFPIKTID